MEQSLEMDVDMYPFFKKKRPIQSSVEINGSILVA